MDAVDVEKHQEHQEKIRQVISEVGKVVVGQEYMVHRLLIGLFTNGHILLEGVPGLAKTLTISTLAQVLHLDFQRIQFTPDLLPADLVGTMIYNQQRNEFIVRKGPIFANFILADEISPDSCRLWDSATGEKLDKDRFRRDLGNVIESYTEVARRLGIMKEMPTVIQGGLH